MLGTSALDACDIYTMEQMKDSYMLNPSDIVSNEDLHKMMTLCVSVPQTHCVNACRLPLWQSHNRLIVKELSRGVAGVYSCAYEYTQGSMKLLRNTSLGDPLEELD